MRKEVQSRGEHNLLHINGCYNPVNIKLKYSEKTDSRRISGSNCAGTLRRVVQRKTRQVNSEARELRYLVWQTTEFSLSTKWISTETDPDFVGSLALKSYIEKGTLPNHFCHLQYLRAMLSIIAKQ